MTVPELERLTTTHLHLPRLFFRKYRSVVSEALPGNVILTKT